MNRARSSGWLLLGLVVLSLLVAAELHFEIGKGPGSRTVGRGSTGSETMPAPLFALVDRDALSVTVDRPLFMPNRQPLEAGPAPAPTSTPRATAPNADRYALSAIIIVDDERIALLADSATGSLIRAREGERIAGWRVEAILEDSAVLRNGDTRAELTLRSFGPPAPPPARQARKRTQAAERNRSGTSPDRPLRRERSASPRLRVPDERDN